MVPPVSHLPFGNSLSGASALQFLLLSSFKIDECREDRPVTRNICVTSHRTAVITVVGGALDIAQRGQFDDDATGSCRSGLLRPRSSG